MTKPWQLAPWLAVAALAASAWWWQTGKDAWRAPTARMPELPVVFCRLPSVINFITGPLARAKAVRNGASTSSACFMVGAVVSCWVVLVFAVMK